MDLTSDGVRPPTANSPWWAGQGARACGFPLIAGLMIAKALQTYGAFVGDYSGAISLYADASATAQAYWSSGVLGNGEVNKISLTSLRVLKLGTTYDNNN